MLQAYLVAEYGEAGPLWGDFPFCYIQRCGLRDITGPLSLLDTTDMPCRAKGLRPIRKTSVGIIYLADVIGYADRLEAAPQPCVYLYPC